MKVQIDIDSELWGRFRSKVINDEGKTLAEVVPGVIEPALRAYLEVPLVVSQDVGELPIVDRIIKVSMKPLDGVIRRCDLCDAATERLFASEDKRICYACWKAAIMAIPVPPPPAPPEAA